MVAPSSLLYWTSSSSSSSSSSTSAAATTTTTTTAMDGGEQAEMRRTTASTRGSSRNKNGKVLAKKTPQRGLGVAQLERLRIQERWKKMTTEFDVTGTTPTPPTTTTTTQSQLNQFPHHQFPFQEQQNLVSSSVIPSSSSTMFDAAGFSFQEQQICNLPSSSSPHLPPVNFVFNPYRGSGVRSVFSDQFQAGNNIHYPFESSSKELSSTQKSSHCLYDKCDVCLKKKRMINGEILGFEGGAAAQYLDRKSFDGSGSDHFLGLDLGRNWTTTVINGDGGNNNNQISLRSSYSSSGIFTNDDQEEVEVMAIHRKGMSTGGGGGSSSSSTSTTTTVLMEYDFFPRKAASTSGSSSSSRRSSSRSVIKKEPISLFGGGDQGGAYSSVVQVGESSSSATTNLLDLSLKLSC